MGFSEDEIKYEYNIHLDNNKFFRVDVIGIKHNRKVIIECGTINKKNKIEELKKMSDEFIHLPYDKDSSLLKPITLEIEKDLWDLFKTNTPRTITLNEAVVELIEKEVKKK